MRDRFLIGKFLQAYTSAYRYKTRRYSATPSFQPTVLKDRFTDRARRFRAQRERYLLRLQLGFALALLLVISAFQLRLHPTRSAAFTAVQQELVTMEEIVQTRQQVTPPPPPRPPVPVEVPNDELIEADDLNLDASLDITEPLTTLPPPPPDEEEQEEVFEPEVFVVVEQMPELVGGLGALMNALVYPEVARRAGLEGTVIVQVIVDAQGQPTQPNVVKSVNEILDDAAVEAVMKQTFVPGRQRSRPVAVSVTIPVHFRLTSG